MNLTLYGTDWCTDCKRIIQYLGEHKIDFRYINIDKDPSAKELVKELNGGQPIIPTLAFDDGTVLVEPSNELVSQKLSLDDKNKTHFTDLLIVGGGPAGLTAAIYTTREGIETEILERKAFGGQAAITDRIENYPGFPEGVSGLKLSEEMTKQAQEFGAKIHAGIEVKKISSNGKYIGIETSEGTYNASSVILALGTDYKRLNVPGETENIGRGVHFCATCDGPFFKNKELIIVGGGNSAMQEGLFLSKFATKITLIAWDEKLTGSEFLIQKVTKDPKFNINYMLQTTKLEKVENKMKLYALDRNTNEEKTFEADGIFVFIGLVPNTDFLKDSLVELDERGFIKTDRTLHTDMKGVFAAGDCRSGATLQIASAVGEGATAALMVREFLKD